jgi:hypothetical protein
LNQSIRLKSLIWSASACVSMLWAASTATVAHAATPDFSRSWISTPLVKTQGPNGPVEGRVYSRFVTTVNGSFQIGTVNYFKFPKPKPSEQTVDWVTEQIKDSMGIKEWNKRKQNDVDVHEAYWEKANRLIRIFSVERGDSLIVSVSAYRLAYVEDVAPEAELLQRQLTGSLDKSIPWLENMTAAADVLFGVTNAYAQLAPGMCPACSSGLYSAALTCASCQQNQLTSQVNQYTSQATTLGNSVNTNWARSNDMIDKALSPTTGFVLGASTAAGAIIGGAAVALVWEGLKGFVGLVSEAITGNKEQAERLAKFKAAASKLNEVNASVLKLEKQLESDLDVVQMIREVGSRGLLMAKVAELSHSNKMFKQAIEENQAMAMRNGATAACISTLNSQAAILGLVQDQADQLLNALGAHDEDEICAAIERDISALEQAELELQKARFTVLNNEKAQKRDAGEAFRESVDEAEEARNRAKAVWKEGRKQADKNYERKMSEWQADFDRAFESEVRRDKGKAYDACIHRLSPVWSNIPFIGRAIIPETRHTCRAQMVYYNPRTSWVGTSRNDIEAGYKKEKDAADAHYYATRDTEGQHARPSLNTNAVAQDGIDKWIEKLQAAQDVKAKGARDAKLAEMRRKQNILCIEKLALSKTIPAPAPAPEPAPAAKPAADTAAEPESERSPEPERDLDSVIQQTR